MRDNPDRTITRRGILKTIGTGAAIGAIGVGTAAAEPTGRHIVGTKDKKTADNAAQKADSVHRRLDFGSVGHAVAGTFPEQALQGLQNNPNVEYIEEDGQMEAIAESTPWGIDRTDADLAQDDGYTGSGGHIAILDSGIDSDHPDLVDNLGAGTAFTSATGYNEPWDDDNGHGTHCAGTAAAVDNNQDVVGIAPGATLHAVKVLSSDGWGSYSDIAAGIQYTADQGWDVASMSLGGSSSSYTMANAIEYATSNGVLCVAAAGNNGPCSDCVLYPARHPDVMAVSATTSSDSLAYFSSTGPEIDIAAPGQSILSTVPGGTAYYSGTSMACPHVSGAAGLLMANGYSNTEARARLEETAEDIGLASNDQGNGLLDVEAAIESTTPTEPKEYNIDTLQASGVESSSATLEGELTGLGGSDSVECYFKYWEKGNKSDTKQFTDRQVLASPGIFVHDVNSLASDTTYVFAARGQTSDGDWTRGKRLKVTTSSGDASAYDIDTIPASGVGSSSVTLEGELTGLGGSDSAECYFKYWEKGNKAETKQFSDREVLTSPGTFAHDVSGLSSDTTYIFAARGQTSDGDWTRGERLEVTTDSGEASAYDIDTLPPTNVGSSTATLEGELTGLGGANSVECYFKYWEKGNKSATAQTSDRQTLNSPGTFSYDANGLSSSTSYVFAARGKTSSGDWTRGKRLEFTL